MEGEESGPGPLPSNDPDWTARLPGPGQPPLDLSIAAMTTPISRRNLGALGLLSAPLLLSRLAHGSPPSIGGQDEDEPTMSRRQLRLAQVSHRFLGVWQLTAARFSGMRLGGKGAAGYLLVTPGHMALEVHMLVDATSDRDNPNPTFQSGIFRWRFVTDTELQTTSLIGNTNITRDGQWRFQQPGGGGSRLAVVTESTLLLEQKEKSRLEFRRVPELPFPALPVRETTGDRER